MVEIRDLSFPTDRKYYTKSGSHIWIKEEGDAVKIGMDSFLTQNAGYLSYLTIDKKEFDQGDSIGSFESAKFVSKFYSPISGKVKMTNEDVINDPIKINKDPYNSWILEIEPRDLSSDLQAQEILEGEEDIKNWITQELKRLDEDAC
jgi:glycine cleavage system H protein